MKTHDWSKWVGIIAVVVAIQLIAGGMLASAGGLCDTQMLIVGLLHSGFPCGAG